jgi:hypothetical protein
MASDRGATRCRRTLHFSSRRTGSGLCGDDHGGLRDATFFLIGAFAAFVYAFKA